MIAIGLDVSELRMGWAVIRYDDEEPLALGTESLRKPDEGWPEQQVIAALTNVRREVERHGDVEEVVVVGIESAYKGRQSMTRLIAHAGVIGMATCAAQMIFGRQAVCYPLGADQWRAACGISNAGKSEDKKLATWMWATARLTTEEAGEVSEDACDALGIATAAVRLTEKREAA